MIYRSAEISHWNRLMIGTMEFWKNKGKQLWMYWKKLQKKNKTKLD